MRIGIDATNIGGGGGITHLKEILINFDGGFFKDQITKIVIFSSQKVLDQLDVHNSIIEMKTHHNLNSRLLNRVFFQLTQYDKIIKDHCDILFSITGDYIGKFRLVVGMSQNMLLYERDIWKEIKHPKEIIRFWINFKKQQKCFKNSSAIIFLSEYAKNYISSVLDIDSKYKKIIYHGISPRFLGTVKEQKPIDFYGFKKPFKLLYVSTVHVYKHQCQVIKAVVALRKKGIPVQLDLVGSVIFKPYGEKMFKIIAREDPKQKFIKFHGHVPYDNIESFYLKTDGIVFASNCENMPNILIESMASGVPVISSNKQPMPEFLKYGGFYFNSLSVDSIVKNIEKLILSPKIRQSMAKINIDEVKLYSWRKTSKDTFKFILEIYNNNNNKKC
ncbi:glycosyltransferase [bacterium]|nr:glycosyltransferase [bacterium]